MVSREELRTRLWPADTFVDFDHSLNAAVRRLRDAWRQWPKTRDFVETVARRGYCFLPPVSRMRPRLRLNFWFIRPGRPVCGGRLGGGGVAFGRTGWGLLLGRRGSVPSSPPPPIVERQVTANPTNIPSPKPRFRAMESTWHFPIARLLPAPDRYRETHPLALPKGSRPAGRLVPMERTSWRPWLPGPRRRLRCGRFTIGGSPRQLSQEGAKPGFADGPLIALLRGAPKSQELWLMRADENSRKIAATLAICFVLRCGLQAKANRIPARGVQAGNPGGRAPD